MQTSSKSKPEPSWPAVSARLAHAVSGPHIAPTQRATGAGGMNREEAPGKSPEDMYIQQKVRVLLMLKKMGSNLTPSEEAFLRNYAGVVHSQMSQLPQHNIDQARVDLPPLESYMIQTK
eukprot:superscaffoldBa00000691_g6604